MYIRPKSKRERDPSETRTRKRLVTHKNQRSNEKENQPNDFKKDDAIKNESNAEHSSANPMNQLNKNSINKLESTDESSNSSTAIRTNQHNDDEQMEEMEFNLQSNQTLKQKLVNLNNSKFVIEEGEENEELVSPDDLDNSDYDYDGEDLSENDENYFGNDYPDEKSDDELDYYRPYEDDYEKEMLEKFEKINWNDDESDYSDES